MRGWFKNMLGRTDSDINIDHPLYRHASVNNPIINIEEESDRHSSIGAEVEVLALKYRQQSLPKDFAGRVLKLEMQCDKGPSYITMDDINNLMDLYTQAVEFYNSTM